MMCGVTIVDAAVASVSCSAAFGLLMLSVGVAVGHRRGVGRGYGCGFRDGYGRGVDDAVKDAAEAKRRRRAVAFNASVAAGMRGTGNPT